MNKPIRLILSPSDALFESLLTDNRVTLLCRTNDVCVLESKEPTILNHSKIGDQKWTRIFENYHLLSANGDKNQGIVVGAFFDWLSDRYSNEIDLSKNLACYETLFDIANQFRESLLTTAVLDIGCGPGTILGTCVAHAAQLLVGYDISEVAAQLAASSGMEVISREHFLKGPARFDIALSAYSMHYACDFTDTLAGVQSSLKPGGIWALNFHKCIGLDAFLARVKLSSLTLAGPVSHSAFGPIVVVKMC